MTDQKLKSCIDACLACAAQCDECASSCLKEENVAMMTRCIELDRECAEACYASARLMGFQGEHATLFCDACAQICDACAEECAKHEASHCQRCAEECRRCAEECRAMASTLA